MTVVIGYVNYAIVAVAGGMLCIKGLADVGALASYLVFVRQAAMPINQLTQLATSCSTRWPVPSACLPLWTLSPRWTRAAWSWCRRATPAWAWRSRGPGRGRVRALA